SRGHKPFSLAKSCANPPPNSDHQGRSPAATTTPLPTFAALSESPPPHSGLTPPKDSNHVVDTAARPMLRQEEDGHRRRPVQGPSVRPSVHTTLVDTMMEEEGEGRSFARLWC